MSYDPNFLSESLPFPTLSDDLLADAFELDGSHILHYTHFSVCQSKSRRMARFVAWNIDGQDLKDLERKGLRFKLDNRVPGEFQLGDELYKNNPYDRGHLARRADLTWGPLKEAQQANEDSFYFTNIVPQHEEFNQSHKYGLWGELENVIKKLATIKDLKVSVIAGPVFREDDPVYRDVQIPREFWKLVAFDSDSFQVKAYVLSQQQYTFSRLDPFLIHEVSLAELSGRTLLGFGADVSILTESREVTCRENVLV